MQTIRYWPSLTCTTPQAFTSTARAIHDKIQQGVLDVTNEVCGIKVGYGGAQQGGGAVRLDSAAPAAKSSCC